MSTSLWMLVNNSTIVKVYFYFEFMSPKTRLMKNCQLQSAFGLLRAICHLRMSV